MSHTAVESSKSLWSADFWNPRKSTPGQERPDSKTLNPSPTELESPSQLPPQAGPSLASKANVTDGKNTCLSLNDVLQIQLVSNSERNTISVHSPAFVLYLKITSKMRSYHQSPRHTARMIALRSQDLQRQERTIVQWRQSKWVIKPDCDPVPGYLKTTYFQFPLLWPTEKA